MDYGELAANLRAVGHEPDAVEGMTAREIALALGVSTKLARQLLRRALDAGVWRLSGRRSVTRIDGIRTLVPAYAPLAMAEKNEKTQNKARAQGPDLHDRSALVHKIGSPGKAKTLVGYDDQA